MTAHAGTRRSDLIALAGDVLETVGCDEFGIAALARAAGIKPPSLYKHFEGLGDIEAELISAGFFALADALEDARGVRAIAAAYREQALARPQLYRLMTSRPLDRPRLRPGAELAAMQALLGLFEETPAHHPRARALWAWAHGLVILDIDGRFPDDADVDASWEILVTAAEGWRASALDA